MKHGERKKKISFYLLSNSVSFLPLTVLYYGIVLYSLSVKCLLKIVEIASEKHCLATGIAESIFLLFLKSESDPEPNQNFSSSEEKLGSERLRALSAAVLMASVIIVVMCCHLQPDHINQHPHPVYCVLAVECSSDPRRTPMTHNQHPHTVLLSPLR